MKLEAVFTSDISSDSDWVCNPIFDTYICILDTEISEFIYPWN